MNGMHIDITASLVTITFPSGKVVELTIEEAKAIKESLPSFNIETQE